MTKIIDWCINHSKSFKTWTHYEKWEYREEVIAGMKTRAYEFGGCALLAIVLVATLFIGMTR